MNNPLVSIIIPTYNRAHLIGETLDSILIQTYTNWECIIVDDGSTDNSDEVIWSYVKKDSRFKYYNRPESHKSGGNGARNYGFEMSKGEYVNWFDSDDIMHAEKLEKQVMSLYDTDYNFAVCQTLIFEDNLNNVIGLRHKNIVSKKNLFDFITLNVVFLTPSALYVRKFLNKNDLIFDENLKAAQEWEFICRVLFFSPLYFADHKPLVYIRRHKDSISCNYNNEERNWNYYLARKKVFVFLENKKLENKSEIVEYLIIYFKNYMKQVVHLKKYKKTFNVFLKSYLPFNSILKNTKTLGVLVLIFITNKGHKLTKNI